MKITWYGHSCFKVETAGGAVVFDPYAPGSVPGLAMPAVEAEAVVCSHGHDDHNWAAGVTLSGRPLTGVVLRRVETCHDEQGGALRGPNTVTILEADGLRLAHLGDLGHMLTGEQIRAIGPVDVLLLPVGGHFTIGPETARDVAAALTPRILIPMHYRGEDFGYEVTGPVEDFLALAEHVRVFDSNELDTDSLETPVTAVLRCPRP